MAGRMAFATIRAPLLVSHLPPSTVAMCFLTLSAQRFNAKCLETASLVKLVDGVVRGLRRVQLDVTVGQKRSSANSQASAALLPGQ
eukprot:6203049-Pleurochrysis_carterae.AAC.1